MSDETHVSDVAFIKALAELLHENDLTELSVKREYGQDDTLNVRVSRRGETVTTQVSATGRVRSRASDSASCRFQKRYCPKTVRIAVIIAIGIVQSL
jgi:acetyl-CoA carboxylase biotin carboxyl carrier protein